MAHLKVVWRPSLGSEQPFASCGAGTGCSLTSGSIGWPRAVNGGGPLAFAVLIEDRPEGDRGSWDFVPVALERCGMERLASHAARGDVTVVTCSHELVRLQPRARRPPTISID